MNARAERNIAWIEANCFVPEGRYVGQQVRLRDFQKKILTGIYDGNTRRVIISVGRKNAKTGLSAMLNLLHLVGPEAKPNTQLFSAAQSRDQAAVLFNLAAKMVRQNRGLADFVEIKDSAKELYVPELGTRYKALSAEAKTAYGLSPVFTVHDELGQVSGPRSVLYEALETASAAHDEPLSIVISTQAPNDGDLLSVLIDDAKENKDPRTKLFLWTADMNADPFAEETIRQANPAFGDFQNADEVLRMADDARRMPSREPEYRNLVLNQRVDMNSPFVSTTVWKACGDPVVEDFEDRPIFGGLDLSEVKDLTALVTLAPVDGIWHCRPTFWLPGTSIRERSRQDRVPYDVWEQQGHLATTPGPTVDYEYVAEFLADLLARRDVRKIAFDRWNWRHLRPWLSKAGVPDSKLEGDAAVFEPMGQGFQSMSPALRDLESALLNKRLVHGGHPVLTMCAANATVQIDPAGNRKLDKAKSHGRIDGMVALAMAMSAAGTYEAADAEESYLAKRDLVVI